MIHQVGFKSKQIKAVNQGQYLKSQKDFIREKTGFFFFLISESINASNILLHFKNQVLRRHLLKFRQSILCNPPGGRIFMASQCAEIPGALGAMSTLSQGRSASSSKRHEGERKSKCTPSIIPLPSS